MQNEVCYFEVEDYSSSTINLFDSGNKINKVKITMKDVEESLGVKLRRAGKYENPDIIVNAYVDVNDRTCIDRRSFRGQCTRYYMKKQEAQNE